MATSSRVMEEGSNYQKEKITFSVGGSTQISAMKRFKNYLDQEYERFLRYGSVEATDPKVHKPQISSPQLRRMAHTGNTMPIFGPANDKAYLQKMMGIFLVKYSTGRIDKIFTLSGPNPLNKDQIFELDAAQLEFKVTGSRLMKFECEGYTLKNTGNPEGKVIDLSSGRETDVQFNKPCAAQKAMKYIGDELKMKPGLKVTSIEMREQMWIAGGERNNTKYSRFDAAVSCEKCRPVLRVAAGGAN